MAVIIVDGEFFDGWNVVSVSQMTIPEDTGGGENPNCLSHSQCWPQPASLSSKIQHSVQVELKHKARQQIFRAPGKLASCSTRLGFEGQ
jgi:hypothetical protein